MYYYSEIFKQKFIKLSIRTWMSEFKLLRTQCKLAEITRLIHKNETIEYRHVMFIRKYALACINDFWFRAHKEYVDNALWLLDVIDDDNNTELNENESVIRNSANK